METPQPNQSPTPAQQTGPAAQMPTTPSAGKILIIEDNLFMAKLLSEKLIRAGFEVTEVQDGQQAVEIIKQDNFSLILLDMPLSGQMNGYDFLQTIRTSKKPNELPIMTLFNLNDPEGMKKSLELGANDTMVKAFADITEIIDRAKEVIASKGKIELTPESKAVEQTSGKEKSLNVPKSKVSYQFIQNLKATIDQLLTKPDLEIPIVNLFDSLMEYAFLSRASDIHMEPLEDKVAVRLRIDGILHDMFELPKSIQLGVITRIKVLSGMRTDEHQTAQDGRFRFTVTNPPSQFDVRVSIVPTYHGENAVLRLLAEQTHIKHLDDLAMYEVDRAKIKNAIHKPYGMILATGPTGSGKTTTLYTLLREIDTREISVITIEDPVEYALEGVDQIQVNNRTGLTFANGLRSILRQDPNVVMVGEIRDEETASIAVNAALTGHLLLSTLHTNDAATTLPRLLDMGVAPFLVASTVNIAIGQRLVRMICNECKEPKTLTDAELNELKTFVSESVLGGKRDFFHGKGCKVCGNTGYLGRLPIYEVLEVDDFIREAIVKRADASDIKKIAIKNGMTTLIEDGVRKALQGLTTIEEILRVVRE